MHALRKALAVALLLPAAAHAHKDDYLGDTFVFVTLERHELEAEYWIDWRSDPRGFLHTAGLEYGLSDRFMVDASVRYAQPAAAGAHLETEFVELRYRFGEEGEHWVDCAASLEWANEEGASGRHRLLEPRVVLSRDFGGWNATVNLVEAIVVDERRRSRLELSAGVRSREMGAVSFGIELQRERALENATRVLPQAWWRLSDDTYLKTGFGYDLGREHERFARLAIESEF